MISNGGLLLNGGYLDFSHPTELKNMFITEIYLGKKKDNINYQYGRLRRETRSIFTRAARSFTYLN